MNLYSTVFININLNEHFFSGGEGVFLVHKWFYQFYTYFGSRAELVTKIPKSTPDYRSPCSETRLLSYQNFVTSYFTSTKRESLRKETSKAILAIGLKICEVVEIPGQFSLKFQTELIDWRFVHKQWFRLLVQIERQISCWLKFINKSTIADFYWMI